MDFRARTNMDPRKSGVYIGALGNPRFGTKRTEYMGNTRIEMVTEVINKIYSSHLLNSLKLSR